MLISCTDAARLIRQGEVVAFPTETVYGLGANALDEAAVQKVYELKGRPRTSPLIVHVASVEMAREQVVAEWPPLAERLARQWWPGPLTLVLPKRSEIPDIVTAGLNTVGVRIPNHPVAIQLIQEAGVPLAAPSANKFTQLSSTLASHVQEAFGDQLAVVDGGACQVGIESTVVAIRDGKAVLLRPGMVALGEIELQQDAAEPAGAHPAPGMHAKHYSPRTPLRIVKGPQELTGSEGGYLWYQHSGYKHDEDQSEGFDQHAPRAHCIEMPTEPADYAARLYEVLHDLDREGLPWIAVEAPPETHEWAAIWDRLRRAASS